MAIPAALILGVILWILMSAVKYWYLKRTKINYTHKFDEKLFEQLTKPSPEALAKLKKMREEGKYPFNRDSERMSAFFDDDDAKGKEAKDGEGDPPRNLFDEIDYRRKHGKDKDKKKREQRFDRSMFDDSLDRLYREVAEGRAKVAEKGKKSGAL